MKILTPEQRFDIARVSTTAANRLVARHLDDVIDNLDELKAAELTPYELLLALNKSGLLTSFLQETRGEPEILLRGLLTMYENLGSEHKQNSHTHAKIGSPAYVAGCIKAADFLRDAYSESPASGFRHPRLEPQEEEMSVAEKKQVLRMADALVCETLIDQLQQRSDHNLASTVSKLTEGFDQYSPAVQQRRFMLNSMTQEMAGNLNRTQHYCSETATGHIFCEHLIELLDSRLSNASDQAESEALQKAKQALSGLSSYLAKAAQRGSTGPDMD